MPLRAVVADDDADVLAAEVDLLQDDGRFSVVAAVGSGAAAVAAASDHAADIVLLDIRMPDGGLWAAQQLRAAGHPAVVVVISSRLDPTLLADLLRAGVRGAFLKGLVASSLPDLLAACHEGQVLLMAPSAADAVTRFATN